MNFAGLDQKRRRKKKLSHRRTRPLCGGRPKRAMREVIEITFVQTDDGVKIKNPLIPSVTLGSR
jgi:hypothetical protein